MAAIGLHGAQDIDRGHGPLLQRNAVVPANAGTQGGMDLDTGLRRYDER